ncbi:MAG: sigma-70 family RNA polymerase sigma factor [Gemmatimonadaceae bacterium]
MTESLESPEKQLVQHLDYIDRTSRYLTRRAGIRSDEADDCVSWIKLRLIENDYAAIRKFRGESGFKTFVTTVVAKLVLDYRVQLRGRWRPSAKALRLGPIAEELERLLHRECLIFEEAMNVMRSSTITPPSEKDLREIYRQLPPRLPLRPELVDVDESISESASDRADKLLEAGERQRRMEEMSVALRMEIDRLPPNDRVALLMDVVDGVSIAGIARVLGVLQRPLYDRLKSLRKSLRTRMHLRGISDDDVRALFDDEVA